MKIKSIDVLEKLDTLPEEEFQLFFATIPPRVKLLVKSGLCDWRKVLPEYYKTYSKIHDQKTN